MNSRERIFTAFKHQEPDAVPIDFCGTNVSGIACKAYKKLLVFEGQARETGDPSDLIQQLAAPDERFLLDWEVDTRGILPKYYATLPLPVEGKYWRDHHTRTEKGLIYRDEWGIEYLYRPESDYYYSQTAPLIPGMELSEDDVMGINFPQPDAEWRFSGIAEKASHFRAQNKVVLLKSTNAGMQETATKLRGMDSFFLDMSLNQKAVEKLLDRITEFKIKYWAKALETVGDLIDIAVEADDYGTQDSLLFSPDTFRSLFKPRWKEIFSFIKTKAPEIKIFFHSCGAVRPLIADFIEMGVEILNPIHIASRGMDPIGLKRDFGTEVIFWGGGIDTQQILPYGTEQQIQDDVKKNIDALAPGGGWIFSPVHNIQADVPPENITALKEALMKYRMY